MFDDGRVRTSPNWRMRFLASVRNSTEAQVAEQFGADIIDCKDPDKGALGALAPDTIAAVRAVVSDAIPVSATVGDDAARSGDLEQRVERASAAGAQFVKIGVADAFEADQIISKLAGRVTTRCNLVAVLLADRAPDFALIEYFARAGFSGVLLDTADKSTGALPEVLPLGRLKEFIGRAHAAGLIAGLAGALRAQHVEALAPLQPDIIGFRGALCSGGTRRNALDGRAVHVLRSLITAAGTANNAA